MHNNSEEQGADLLEIQRAIAVLYEPGEVAEIRVPGKFGAISGYFDDHEKLAKAVKQLSDSGKYEAVYYTLNSCHGALLARRAKNQLHLDVKETTSDIDIVRRRWLLVDFDPKRPKGVSATTEEKRAAKKLMCKVENTLRNGGWPLPLIALSGNGYHLLYRVDEPNDAETTELFKKCLQAIADQFPKDEVDIDTKVFNAARITKAYGSMAAKGVDTKERPHRFSKILFIPKSVRVVKRSQLKKLASTITSTKKGLNRSDKGAAAISSDDVDKFLAWGNAAVKSVTATADGGKKWVLSACPFNAEHTNSPAVFLSADGALGFKCFHASCGDKHWKQFREAVEEKKGEKFHFTTRNDGIPYESTAEGIIHHTFTRNGDKIEKVLTNFNARILTNVIEDDGIEKNNVFEIEARCRHRLQRFCIAAADFPKMVWPIEKLGGEAILAPGTGAKDHARAAIQLLSRDIARRTVFTHTGWHRIGGEWFYLHGDGAIGRDGLYNSVKVKLPKNLVAFRLPEPPTDEQLNKAVRASLRFLDLAPHSCTVPLFAAIWRSVLGASDFSLHATGPTGTFKTSVTALTMQHFGAGFDSAHLPGSWSSTANANAALQFTLKDTVFVIDDFVPRGSRADVERSHRDADRIFRGQGNNAARGRLGRDGVSLREANPPRGLTLSTGEDSPRGESLASRVWRLGFSLGDVDAHKLTACQSDAAAGVYALVLAAFLQYLAPLYATVKRCLPKHIEEYRAKATRDGQHNRTPAITANLMLGIQYFLRFALHHEILTKAEAQEIRTDAWRSLLSCASAQTRGQASEEPARRFIDLIASALSSGDAALTKADTGYVPSQTRGHMIGWTAGDWVLLEPDAAFATAQRLAEQQGEGLPVSKQTMWKRLRERGFLVRHDEDHNTVQYTVAGVRRRVLCIRKADVHLLSDADDVA
jgi:hypothetical protein